jgi:hypothetical protein
LATRIRHVSTNLRKHVVVDLTCTEDGIVWTRAILDIPESDLVRVKITGTRDELSKVDKQTLGASFGFPKGYKLDKIYKTDTQPAAGKVQTEYEQMDVIVDSTSESEEQKKYLKKLWRDIHETS